MSKDVQGAVRGSRGSGLFDGFLDLDGALESEIGEGLLNVLLLLLATLLKGLAKVFHYSLTHFNLGLRLQVSQEER